MMSLRHKRYNALRNAAHFFVCSVSFFFLLTLILNNVTIYEQKYIIKEAVMSGLDILLLVVFIVAAGVVGLFFVAASLLVFLLSRTDIHLTHPEVIQIM